MLRFRASLRVRAAPRFSTAIPPPRPPPAPVAAAPAAPAAARARPRASIGLSRRMTQYAWPVAGGTLLFLGYLGYSA